jgi:hypothetical protein
MELELGPQVLPAQIGKAPKTGNDLEQNCSIHLMEWN